MIKSLVIHHCEATGQPQVFETPHPRDLLAYLESHHKEMRMGLFYHVLSEMGYPRVAEYLRDGKTEVLVPAAEVRDEEDKEA